VCSNGGRADGRRLHCDRVCQDVLGRPTSGHCAFPQHEAYVPLECIIELIRAFDQRESSDVISCLQSRGLIPESFRLALHQPEV
jgi:hypothetical protein